MSVSDLATSPDGKWVATASNDSTIILWDITDGAMVRQWVAHNYKAVTSLAFCPEGRYLLSGGEDSKLKIWDLAESLREVTTLEGHTNHVARCAWSSRGDVIASGSLDTTVRLWDAHTFHELHVLVHAKGNRGQLIAFSPDGRWLVSGSSSRYHLWDVASGTLHRSFRDSGAGLYLHLAAAFDPGSTRLLVAEWYRVKVVDVETGKELAVLEGLDGTSDVAFSPDGTLVLAASLGGTIKLWNAHTWIEPTWLAGHEGKRIHQARFSPCGQYIASVSDDGTMRLWRTTDGTCVERFSEYKDGGSVLHVSFSLDGETLWSGDENGTVTMRYMPDIISAHK